MCERGISTIVIPSQDQLGWPRNVGGEREILLVFFIYLSTVFTGYGELVNF